MSVFATRAMLAFALVFLGACGTERRAPPCRVLAIDWESGSCEGWECQVTVGIDATDEECSTPWDESRSYFLVDRYGRSPDPPETMLYLDFLVPEVEVPYLMGEKNQHATFRFRHNAGGDGTIILYFAGRVENLDGAELVDKWSWKYHFGCSTPDGYCALAFDLLDTTTRNPRIVRH